MSLAFALGILGGLTTLVYIAPQLLSNTYVQSTYDKRWYNVKKGPFQEKAADTLAHLREKLEVLIKYILEKDDEHDWHSQIRQINLNELREAEEHINHVAYTINKGEAMYFCLRKDGKDDGEINSDMNTLVYVAIHEMAHVVTKTIGHTAEFWENQERLLKYASQCEIYTPINYENNSVSYCGVPLQYTENEKDNK